MEADAVEPEALADMKIAEDALRRPIYLPSTAQFSPGPHIYVLGLGLT